MADDNNNAPNQSAADGDGDKGARRAGPTIELSQGEFSSSTQSAASHSGLADDSAASGPERVEATDSGARPHDRAKTGRAAQWLYPPLAGAVAAGLVAGGILIVGQRLTPRVAVPPAPASTGDLAARITQLESIVAAIPKTTPGEADPVLPARVSALEQSAQGARETVSALRRQIETLSTALAELKAGGKDATKDKDAAKDGVTNDNVSSPASSPSAPASALLSQVTTDLADLQARLRAAEDKLAQNITALAELAARPVIAPAPVIANPDPSLRLSIVAAMLDMQVRAGEPFGATLALAKKLVAEQGRGVNLAALDAFAEQGLPAAERLRASLVASIPAPKSSEEKPAPPQEASQSMVDHVWAKLSAHAAQVVRVRKVDQAASAIVAPDYAPLAAALHNNDLGAARAALLALPQPQRAFAQRWLSDMDARDKALAAASAFAQDALAAFGASGAPAGTAPASTSPASSSNPSTTR